PGAAWLGRAEPARRVGPCKMVSCHSACLPSRRGLQGVMRRGAVRRAGSSFPEAYTFFSTRVRRASDNQVVSVHEHFVTPTPGYGGIAVYRKRGRMSESVGGT